MNFIPLASSSRGNAYLLTSEGCAPLLLEAGVSIKQLQKALWKQDVNLSDLAGCLVSHEHQDHCKAVDALLKAGVDCFMSKGTAEIMGWDGHHRCHMFERPTDGNYRVVDIDSRWSAFPFVLEHDAEEPTGFAVGPYGRGQAELLAFIPDTGFVRSRFKGITILAIECNNIAEILSRNIVQGNIPAEVGRRVRRSHMSLERVISMLKANDLSRCREIILLHLSSANSDERRMILEVERATGIPTSAAGE